MTSLWTRSALETATGGHFAASLAAADEMAITGVSIDTRTLQPGDLFIALVGDASDGHAHVKAAFAKGAAAAMVHVPMDDPRALIVANTMTALWDLGRAGRARFAGKLVAVTGSVGKTTTKDMLRVALAALGPTHAASASYNNHWGVPLTLARLPATSAFCVSEIGMNHPGEIAPLAALARPDVAVITTIGSAHMGHMGSLDAIALEKSEIIAALSPADIAIVPDDAEGQDRFEQAAQRAKALLWHAGFGLESEAALTGLATDGSGSRFVATFSADDTAVPVALSAPGPHLARNALTALAAVKALGQDVEKAAHALAGFAPGTGRGAVRAILDGVTLLDESYNASVLSIRASLEVLRLLPAERRIAVLGDIRELEEFASAEHLSLAQPVKDSANIVFCCGPHMKELFDALPASQRGSWAPDAATLAPQVRAALRSGDLVLVKGSLGSRMRDVIAALTTNVGAA